MTSWILGLATPVTPPQHEACAHKQHNMCNCNIYRAPYEKQQDGWRGFSDPLRFEFTVPSHAMLLPSASRPKLHCGTKTKGSPGFWAIMALS